MRFHASCAARAGSGGFDAVLLLGPSGSGKSDLLLRLLSQGWRMVADDQVVVEDGQARAQTALAGMLEARGLGLFRLDFLDCAPVRLAVQCGVQPVRLPAPQRFAPLDIPLVTIDPAQHSAPERVELALDAVLGRVRHIVGALTP